MADDRTETMMFNYSISQPSNPRDEIHQLTGFDWQQAREHQVNLAYAGGYGVVINTPDQPTNFRYAVTAETAKAWMRQAEDEIGDNASRAFWARLVEIADAAQGIN